MQSQDWPGAAGRLDPAPDHGEQTYAGRGWFDSFVSGTVLGVTRRQTRLLTTPAGRGSTNDEGT